MTKFLVKVRQTRTVDIEVEAASMVAARKQIEEYGPDLAVVDYDNVGEYPQQCRIVSVKQMASVETASHLIASEDAHHQLGSAGREMLRRKNAPAA